MPNVRQNIRIRQSVFGRIFGFGKNHYSAHPYCVPLLGGPPAGSAVLGTKRDHAEYGGCPKEGRQTDLLIGLWSTGSAPTGTKTLAKYVFAIPGKVLFH